MGGRDRGSGCGSTMCGGVQPGSVCDPLCNMTPCIHVSVWGGNGLACTRYMLQVLLLPTHPMRWVPATATCCCYCPRTLDEVGPSYCHQLFLLLAMRPGC